MENNKTYRQKEYQSNRFFALIHGDITLEKVDAIVNPANRLLDHGGGLAGLIVRKGGIAIQNESDQWITEHGPIDHNQPAYTSAGKLPFRYVIHAVGPVWGSGDEDRKLADSVNGSLSLAATLGLSSIALPAISTGIFRFPLDRAAGIILKTIDRYLTEQIESSLQMVHLVIFDLSGIKIFVDEFDRHFPE